MGESNGGATSLGVTRKDTIKIVLLLGTHEQQDTARTSRAARAPKDHATGPDRRTSRTRTPTGRRCSTTASTRGAASSSSSPCTPTGPDEAAQRADALIVAEMKPFIVVSSAPAAAGRRPGVRRRPRGQEDHRVLRRHHQRRSGQAGALPLPRRLRQQRRPRSTACSSPLASSRARPRSGRVTSPTRSACSASIRPETGIDWQYFTSTAKKEGLTLAPERRSSSTACRSTPARPSTKNQEEAPILVAKLKDAGVTTVLLFTSFGMNQQLLKAVGQASTTTPSGCSRVWARRTSRSPRGSSAAVAPDQMKHVFGLGDLPLYVAGIERPAGELVQLVLGPEPGHLLGRHRRHALPRERGRQPRRTEAHAADLPAGPVQHAAVRRRREQPGAELHVRLRDRSSGLPYNEYSQVGLDYAVMWWNPTDDGQGQDPLRRRHRPVHVHRRRQALLRRCSGRRASRSCSTRATRSREFNGLPASDTVPDYPCTGCPRTKS